MELERNGGFFLGIVANGSLAVSRLVLRRRPMLAVSLGGNYVECT